MCVCVKRSDRAGEGMGKIRVFGKRSKTIVIFLKMNQCMNIEGRSQGNAVLS